MGDFDCYSSRNGQAHVTKGGSKAVILFTPTLNWFYISKVHLAEAKLSYFVTDI